MWHRWQSRGEIGSRVIGDVVVQVSASDYDLRPTMTETIRQISLVLPGWCERACPVHHATGRVLIEPAPVGQNTDDLAVRATAVFACPFGPAEADRMGKLAPVDWVETPQLRLDRHGPPASSVPSVLPVCTGQAALPYLVCPVAFRSSAR